VSKILIIRCMKISYLGYKGSIAYFVGGRQGGSLPFSGECPRNAPNGRQIIIGL